MYRDNIMFEKYNIDDQVELCPEFIEIGKITTAQYLP